MMSVLSLVVPEDKRKDKGSTAQSSLHRERVLPTNIPVPYSCGTMQADENNRKDSLESVYSSNSRLNLLNKRKRLTPLADMSQSARSKSGDRFVAQRVLSAKAHRVKQLQNQLSDAHYHLQELSNENRVLRAIQKKHEIVLQRYENSTSELPQVLNQHTEEIRIQQSKYKILKVQLKEVMQKLKERDIQLQNLRDEHHHLQELCKDKNLLEREKLQSQNVDLALKVQHQSETISMLQRRLALEAKNFKHQLQSEINKHKDTRADLDLAINNADKLSTIIEMKEKLISTVASRPGRSPIKVGKSKSSLDTSGRSSDERHNADQSLIAKMCESSRNLNSALSYEEEMAIEPRSKYATKHRTNSTSSRTTLNRKNSKESDDMIELAKSVQDGMAELAISDDAPVLSIDSATQRDAQRKMDALKSDLMNKIRTQEDEKPRITSAFSQIVSPEESVEQQAVEKEELERPKSRGRRNSSVTFYDNVEIEESTSTVAINDTPGHSKPHRENSFITKLQRENSVLNMAERRLSSSEKKMAGKPIIEKYCQEIIHEIDKSSKVIDSHVKQFQTSRFQNEQIVQQLQAVDKIHSLVSSSGEIPSAALTELNNNFKVLTNQVFGDAPSARKRSISSRRGSKDSSRSTLMGDVGMSNQDLLDDLLGKK